MPGAMTVPDKAVWWLRGERQENGGLAAVETQRLTLYERRQTTYTCIIARVGNIDSTKFSQCTEVTGLLMVHVCHEGTHSGLCCGYTHWFAFP
jgi:hypothetical protein